MNDDKEIALLHLQHSKDAYKETKNPVHVWRGYCSYRKAGIDMPEWIQKYLDECATNIACLSMKKHPEVNQIVSRTKICDAFNLKESFVTSFHKESKPVSLCFYIFTYLLYDDATFDNAYYLAAEKFLTPKDGWKNPKKKEYEEGKSPSSFRRAWVDSGHLYIDQFSQHFECSTNSNIYKAFKLCNNWDEIKHFFKNSPSS
ncbi:MAG: hypothetical protein L3J75_03545 [Methylococcaceae bacterium]|nr:hypothetical protein [Methylococcaceae bacterium]